MSHLTKRTNYSNYYATYHMNPTNFDGSDRAFVDKHNANISKNKSPNYSGLTGYVESKSTFSATSECYIQHSYFGNNNSVIRTCIG